jgi:hypothetical protein
MIMHGHRRILRQRPTHCSSAAARFGWVFRTAAVALAANSANAIQNCDCGRRNVIRVSFSDQFGREMDCGALPLQMTEATPFPKASKRPLKPFLLPRGPTKAANSCAFGAL